MIVVVDSDLSWIFPLTQGNFSLSSLQCLTPTHLRIAYKAEICPYILKRHDLQEFFSYSK